MITLSESKGAICFALSPFPKPFLCVALEAKAETCYHALMAFQSFPSPPPTLSPVHKVTLQFITIAMCAVAFLVVAEANGYFSWWEGDFSFFGWIFEAL